MRTTLGAHLVLASYFAYQVYVKKTVLIGYLPELYVSGHSSFAFHFLLDSTSSALFWVFSFVCFLVAHFSFSYLHRDPGYVRFFNLLLLFVGGISIVLVAKNLEFIFLGWEVVGLTSVLLISFFQFRNEPPSSSLYAFVTYKICDLFLLAGILCLHNSKGEPADWVCALLVFGCLGKAAQWPFSAWLPRAMEGPTPSSAVFYGAVSTHLGTYLLLRLSPYWVRIESLVHFLTFIGLFTALYASFVGRTRSDAKTQLAYAAMAQLGLIVVEISLGWNTLSLFHMVGHSFIRTFQFLKAPSLLHEFHHMGMHSERYFRRSVFSLEKAIPEKFQAWLYRQSLLEGNLPGLIRKLIVLPYQNVSLRFLRMETSWLYLLCGSSPEGQLERENRPSRDLLEEAL